MGRIKGKQQIPLSIFYLKYFAYIFVGICVLGVAIISIFTFLISQNVIYPANYVEIQVRNAYRPLQQAETITDDIIPEYCDYAVFDLDGKLIQGTISEKESEEVWNVVTTGVSSAKYSYMIVPRNSEYCILRYKVLPQYKSVLLQKRLMNPQLLMFLLFILGILIIIVIVARRFGKNLDKQLHALAVASNKIACHDLDFEIQVSGIKEVDSVLFSMNEMRMALKESLEKQWQIEQEKNKQMSSLAHDLKTPLTLVRGNSELLLESDLSDFDKTCVEYIASSALQLQNYVQTLIEVTKSNLGYLFQPNKESLTLLLQEIKNQLNGLCKANQLIPDWKCILGDNEISVDHDLFIRAIVNIISNATEHTPKGGIVKCHIFDNDNMLNIIVEDSGNGFSPEALRHGTDQFFMDDASRNSDLHFGMGLYFANSIIQKHNGSLKLGNSEITGGAIVTIKVPLSI